MKYIVEKKIRENLVLLKQKKIPQNYPEEFLKDRTLILKRPEYIKLQGFTLLTDDWVSILAKWIGDRKVLEVFSGCGSLAKCLKDKGIDIKATDNFEWKDKWNALWYDVEELDAIGAIERYNDVDIILMSWAPLNSDIDYKSLEKMREVNPNAVMLILGEFGGCTNSQKFVDSLNEIEDEIVTEINRAYISWPFVHDKFTLGK